LDVSEHVTKLMCNSGKKSDDNGTVFIWHLTFTMRSSVMTQMKYVRWLITLRLFLWYFYIIKWQTWEDDGGENSSSYINILYKPH